MAAFKSHIGLYPPVRDEALLPLVEKFAGPKGNLKFPLSDPIPLGLIKRIVTARIMENLAVELPVGKATTRVRNSR